jgi:hypothetical protein
MSHLATLQSDFQAYLVDENKGTAFAQFIVDDAKVGANKRLGIYYDAYRIRIIEALATAYPKLKIMLGDDLFDSTALTYIDQFPSTFRNLRWFGGNMQAHLQHTLPQHPIAAEMAAFEWALSLAFDAEDAAILSLQDLAEIPAENWANLKFVFHPSLQLLALQWNVVPVWNALDKDEAPPSLVQVSEPCLIWQHDLNSHFRSLELTEYAAIQLAISGGSFGLICEKLQENASEEVATMQAAQYLSSWLNEGLISASFS